ncbi:MAG: hypothetical protein K8R53_09215 [Bacteroidales bacterium]|nr:hypothetical protein [Bacteroidales bacterium]
MIDPSGNDHYYAHDHLFSPVALLASDGSVEERYEYDAYGKCTIWDATFANTRSTSLYDNDRYFTGQMLDALDNNALFIMYYKNRYYLPDIGRFVQTDPLGIVPNAQKPNRFAVHKQYSDGMNLYEYDKTNPLTNYDSYGLQSISSNMLSCCRKKPKRGDVCPVRKFFWCCPKGWKKTKQEDCSCRKLARKLADWALQRAHSSGLIGMHNGPADAFRHCIWICQVTQELGNSCAWSVGTGHEYWDNSNAPHKEREMDLHNNREGRKCGEDCTRYCTTCCMDKLNKKELVDIGNGQDPDYDY